MRHISRNSGVFYRARESKFQPKIKTKKDQYHAICLNILYYDIIRRIGRKKSIVSNVWLAGLAMVVGAVLKFYDDGGDGTLYNRALLIMVIGWFYTTTKGAYKTRYKIRKIQERSENQKLGDTHSLTFEKSIFKIYQNLCGNVPLLTPPSLR